MNEAKMVLKMFEEGKITMEEAEALLEALGMSGQITASANGFEHRQVEQKKVSERSGVPLTEDEVDELIDELEDRFEELDDQMEELDDEADEELDTLADHLDDLEDIAEISEEKKELLRVKIEELRQKVEARRAQIKASRQQIRDKRKEYKKQYRNRSTAGDDWRAGLDELSRGVEDFRKKFDSETMNEVRAAMREVGDEINEGMNELRHGLKQGMKDVKRSFRGNNFWDMLNGIIGSVGFGWPGISIEDELSGTFDPSAELVEIDVKTSNGRIEIEGTDEADYRLHLLYQVHAENEEEAHRLKNELVIIDQLPDALRVRSKEGRLGSVSVKLYVPKRLEAHMKLLTSNGRIVITNIQNNSRLEMGSSNGRLELGDLRVKELEGHTSNGRIEIKNAVAQTMDMVTSNGAIYIAGICEQVHARTSNGTISVYPYVSEKASLDLSTSNGRIKVVVEPDTGLDVEATSTMGSINLDTPDLEYERRIEKHSRHEFKAHTRDYTAKAKQLQIEANTSLGSIYIGHVNE